MWLVQLETKIFQVMIPHVIFYFYFLFFLLFQQIYLLDCYSELKIYKEHMCKRNTPFQSYYLSTESLPYIVKKDNGYVVCEGTKIPV